MIFKKLHSKLWCLGLLFYRMPVQNLWNAILENGLPVFLQSLVCQINYFLTVTVCPETRWNELF